MPVTTVSAAVHITPVVIKTFLKHYKAKGKKCAHGDEAESATDDIFFDEGFNIVKAFIELGTYNTIESLQAFTNTHVPAPPWAAVAPITIPILTCNAAADLLIEWFGPDDLKYIVGGHKWWQVRGLDGVDAEWITEREFLRDLDEEMVPERKLRWEEETVLRMEHMDAVMFYVHGGAYFWGSINSHRYQMIRYARKFHGRLFAVNYRKAPQYPWPCPLHDVIAAYLYLTRPPSHALHKAVPPEKIVIAGDSAGAGLCVALLTVLRDLGIPQPAGAVLISPWVDLTHSFPSVMSNTLSDIIPPHGFIHKPSTTWPMRSQMSQTVARTETNPPPIPGHADETKPSLKRDHVAEALPQEPLASGEVPSQASMVISADIAESSHWVDSVTAGTDRADGMQAGPPLETSSVRPHSVEEHEPKPPKVLMQNPNDVPLELQSQIQIYATNEQLTHPLVSPLLQASLGNLCPLYILAGNSEVLIDEIIYLAHKAAYPASYPLRQGAMGTNKRQQDNSKKFTAPTNVHLQVYDGMPHVLTVFGYTESAGCAYRSIAQFAKHVTRHTTYLGNFPFPELYKEVALEESVCDSDSELVKITRSKPKSKSKSMPAWFHKKPKDKPSEGRTVEKGDEDPTPSVTRDLVSPSSDNVALDAGGGIDGDTDKEEGTSSATHKTSGVIMIRERVDIHGRVRPMEPPEEIPALRIPPSQIGLIKEAPVRRWLRGQAMWDEQFKRQSKKVFEKRKKFKEKAESIVQHAIRRGLVVTTDATEAQTSPEREGGGGDEQDMSRPTAGSQGRGKSTRSMSVMGVIDEDLRFGPLDLDDENPPPSAIAGRRDTPEALALLRKCVYHTAPVTHNMVPKRKTMEVIKATFDPSDHPVHPPPQSEQQVKANIIPMHGLRVWDFLVGYMVQKKAKRRAQQVVTAVGNSVSDMVKGGETSPAASRAVAKEEHEKQI